MSVVAVCSLKVQAYNQHVHHRRLFGVDPLISLLRSTWGVLTTFVGWVDLVTRRNSVIRRQLFIRGASTRSLQARQARRSYQILVLIHLGSVIAFMAELLHFACPWYPEMQEYAAERIGVFRPSVCVLLLRHLGNGIGFFVFGYKINADGVVVTKLYESLRAIANKEGESMKATVSTIDAALLRLRTYYSHLRWSFYSFGVMLLLMGVVPQLWTKSAYAMALQIMLFAPAGIAISQTHAPISFLAIFSRLVRRRGRGGANGGNGGGGGGAVEEGKQSKGNQHAAGNSIKGVVMTENPVSLQRQGTSSNDDGSVGAVGAVETAVR